MTNLVKRLRERADLARHSLEGGGWRYFSAADIANYDQAASRLEELEAELAAAYEKAAQVADDHYQQPRDTTWVAPDIATAIRALKDKGE